MAPTKRFTTEQIVAVPLGTVRAWLGHSTIEMTSRYLHHLGDFADRSALDLLNGARGALSDGVKTPSAEG